MYNSGKTVEQIVSSTNMTQQQISSAKPYNFIFGSASSQNILSKAAGGTANWLLAKTGLIAKRKRKMI
jgi:hypothetical protein